MRRKVHVHLTIDWKNKYIVVLDLGLVIFWRVGGVCVGLGSLLSGGSPLSGPTRHDDIWVGYLSVNANEFVSHTCALRVPIF